MSVIMRNCRLNSTTNFSVLYKWIYDISYNCDDQSFLQNFCYDGLSQCVNIFSLQKVMTKILFGVIKRFQVDEMLSCWRRLTLALDLVILAHCWPPNAASWGVWVLCKMQWFSCFPRQAQAACSRYSCMSLRWLKTVSSTFQDVDFDGS